MAKVAEVGFLHGLGYWWAPLGGNGAGFPPNRAHRDVSMIRTDKASDSQRMKYWHGRVQIGFVKKGDPMSK